MLGDELTITTNLPSTARVSLMRQPKQNRYVLHLLHANTILRGSAVKLSPEGYVRDSKPVEVIEDLLPLRDARDRREALRKGEVGHARAAGHADTFTIEKDRIKLTVDEFTCHQMIALSVA